MVLPTFSVLSCATLSATPMAEIRRGWVQTRLTSRAVSEASHWSSRNWGTWVDLPQPVIPLTITTWEEGGVYYRETTADARIF